MRILGHFLYLRIHDNMFTVLGVLGGFRVSLIRITVPSVYACSFFPWRPFQDKQRNRCSRTDAISYENTFLPDYKLPDAS